MADYSEIDLINDQIKSWEHKLQEALPASLEKAKSGIIDFYNNEIAKLKNKLNDLIKSSNDDKIAALRAVEMAHKQDILTEQEHKEFESLIRKDTIDVHDVDKMLNFIHKHPNNDESYEYGLKVLTNGTPEAQRKFMSNHDGQQIIRNLNNDPERLQKTIDQLKSHNPNSKELQKLQDIEDRLKKGDSHPLDQNILDNSLDPIKNPLQKAVNNYIATPPKKDYLTKKSSPAGNTLAEDDPFSAQPEILPDNSKSVSLAEDKSPHKAAKDVVNANENLQSAQVSHSNTVTQPLAYNNSIPTTDKQIT